MLTLKEFIKETLREITEATIEFADDNQATGANPNPAIRDGASVAQHGLVVGIFDHDKNRHYLIMPVEFDVAVSVEDKDTKGAGGGLKVVSFLKAEGHLEQESISSSVSRIKFKIPLQLPDTGANPPPLS